MTANKPKTTHPWSAHHALRGKPKPPNTSAIKYSSLRKPSFTSAVREGLLKIANSYVTRSESERRAIMWIFESCEHAERALVIAKLQKLERSRARG